MTVIPSREPVRQAGQTYFVSSQTAERKPLFRHQRWADLFLKVVEHYRSSYLLHEYVLMPDHIHLVLTPLDSLERAMQNIKGGFSYRAKKEFGWQGEVWQKGFTDHRIRDFQDWEQHVAYIRNNPAKARLSRAPDEYLYCSAMGPLVMDAIPQRLKPLSFCGMDGGAEAPPLQSGENDAPLSQNAENASLVTKVEDPSIPGRIEARVDRTSDR
ncbi:MAG: REP-associated tyrosine transposase [Acidobacteriaceae bacterium]